MVKINKLIFINKDVVIEMFLHFHIKNIFIFQIDTNYY